MIDRGGENPGGTYTQRLEQKLERIREKCIKANPECAELPLEMQVHLLVVELERYRASDNIQP